MWHFEYFPFPIRWNVGNKNKFWGRWSRSSVFIEDTMLVIFWNYKYAQIRMHCSFPADDELLSELRYWFVDWFGLWPLIAPRWNLFLFSSEGFINFTPQRMAWLFHSPTNIHIICRSWNLWEPVMSPPERYHFTKSTINTFTRTWRYFIRKHIDVSISSRPSSVWMYYFWDKKYLYVQVKLLITIMNKWFESETAAEMRCWNCRSAGVLCNRDNIRDYRYTTLLGFKHELDSAAKLVLSSAVQS